MKLLFRAKEVETGIWRKGFFTRKKEGSLIIPVIETEKEWDSGDFIETFHIDGNTLGQRVCEDKHGNTIWSNSKVKYYDKIYSLKYSVNGWYIDDGILSNFDENEIEVVAD